MSVWRGARVGERDWKGDASCLEGLLNRLQADSYHTGDDDPTWGRARLEGALVARWCLLMQEMTPAGGTRGGRLSGSGAAPYSPRQLSYLATAARELLTARQVVIQDTNEWFQGGLSTPIIQPQDPIEDLIHLLAIILDQARDYFLKTHVSNGIFDDTLSKDIKKPLLSGNKNSSSKDTLKRHKLKNCYDASAAYLIDAVRRDSDTQKEDLTDDCILIRTLLKWLYKAVDEDKKYLSPVLKPYLELMFVSSHENSWHLEEFKSRICSKELNSLTSFCKLVHDGNISPAQGLVEAALKGWKWAENMLEILDTITNAGTVLRLVFPNPIGKDLKFDLSLPADVRERDKWNSFHASKKTRLVHKLNMAERCVVEAFACSLDNEAMGFEGIVQTSKSEEILSTSSANVNNGDLSKSHTLRSNTGTIDTTGTSESKYLTIRSISSKYSTLRNSESLFGSCWSAGDTLKLKHGVSRPTVLEEVNQNNDGTVAEYDDAEFSLHCCLRDASPLTLTLDSRQSLAPHREYKGIIRALINMQRYSVLQELAGWLSGREERSGALKALHRLARGGRRASGPMLHQSPSAHRHNYTLSPKRTNMQHKIRASVRQYYRRRNIDAMSGDESCTKKSGNKTASSPENSIESECHSPSSRLKDEQLDLEIQREYLQNITLQELGQNAALSDHYLNLCREAIRDSNLKSSRAAILEFNKEIGRKGKLVKDKHRSSSVGRKGGSDNIRNSKNNLEKYGMTNTLGRTVKELKVSSDSLLGTCREARLHHAASRSALPGVGSSDIPFGDAFKVSPLYSDVHSEYDVMTHSILQGAVSQPGRDRQRHLTALRDRQYP